MSEVIATVGSENLPETLRQYSELQFKQDSIGRVAFYGVNGGQTRLAEADVLEAYGHDINQAQEPVTAVWRSAGHDFPVTVVGSYGRSEQDNEEYLRVADSKVGIPRSELHFPSVENQVVEEIPASELERLRQEVGTLSEQVE
jgi:hypothetical protein